jgi:hypothetical protein
MRFQLTDHRPSGQRARFRNNDEFARPHHNSMSSDFIAERTTAPPLPVPAGLSMRDLCLPFAATVCGLAVAGYFLGETGLKMLPVGLGWPHIVLGFLFYAGKIARGEPRYRSAAFVLALLTIAIWAAHYNYNLTRLIYLFFFYHAFKDEIFTSAFRRAKDSERKARIDLALVTVAVVLLLLIPQPRDLRVNSRTAELTGSEFSRSGWTLISFDPVANSQGREFYFHLHAPQTAGLRAFVGRATTADTRRDGEILIGDEKWTKAADLVIQPYYGGDERTPPGNRDTQETIPVLLTGGHRVGQTFVAEKENLAGIWLPVERLEASGEATRFVFAVETEPALPRPLSVANLRVTAIILLMILAAWRLFANWKADQSWVVPLTFATVFAGGQALLGTSLRMKDTDTHFFQLVVVFHYLLWYVFSFQRLRERKVNARPSAVTRNGYDRFLRWLGQPLQFGIAVIVLNAISVVGVCWYYMFSGPTALRFAFDYNYFLYALVFHVTFSLQPWQRPKESRPLSPAVAT